MGKIPIEKLSPYLPFKLKVKTIGLFEGDPVFIMTTDTAKTNDAPIQWVLDEDNIKPILHPLSDLPKVMSKLRDLFFKTSELKDGSASLTETLVYEDGFKIKIEDYHYRGDSVHVYYKYISDFEIYQKLLEWHFDIYGLIPEGLAIDVNTLNP